MKRIERGDIFKDVDNVLEVKITTQQIKIKKRSKASRLRSKVDDKAMEIRLKKETMEFLI